MDESERIRFCAWLKQQSDLSDNVIRDTASRLCRIEKIMPLNTNGATDDFIFRLGKKAEFSKLSQSVKSQLKRAYKLYHQYKVGR